MRVVILSIASIISATGLLFAGPENTEHPNIIGDNWSCGKGVDITPDMTAFFVPQYIIHDTGEMPNMVAGVLKDPYSHQQHSMLYVNREAGVWEGIPVGGQESFASVHISGPRAVLFSHITVEGAGPAYTVVSTSDAFKTIQCAELAAPTEDNLEHMKIYDVSIDNSGNGRVLGAVNRDDKSECFESSTSDHGADWTKPKSIGKCVANVFQEIAPMQEHESSLLESLREFRSDE